MNRPRSVVVIGAGVVGITTAYFLRRHGMDVTVLESNDLPARGASYGNGGYYQASLPDPWNAPGAIKMFMRAWWNSISGKANSSAFVAKTLALPGLMGWGLKFLSCSNERTFFSHMLKNRKLAQYSLAVVGELNAAEAINYNWSQNGALIVFRDEPSMQVYLGIAEVVREQGAIFESLDRDALLAQEPSLGEIRDELQGAVYFSEDQFGNSRAFCEQLSKIAADQGVEFNYGSGAEAITESDNCVRVRTPRGDVEAESVVIAAGANSKKLAKTVGIKLPIAPAKGYSLSVPMGDWENRPSHVIADMGTHAGVNPMGDTLRVAGTAEFSGMSEGISAKRAEYLVDLIRQMFPSFADTIDPAECDPWAGHRPLSADGIPMIGETPVKGVYLNTGHGGLGWTQAPGSAKALADQMAGVPAEFELGDYSIGRFA